jgi:hypothetical protein
MPSKPQKPTQIRRHQKTTFRRHFLREWLEARDMEPTDLVRVLNEPEDMETPIDKSQVYRWIKGQLPHGQTLTRIAAALELLNFETGEPDPELLLAHPSQDWIARKFKDRDHQEYERMKQMLDLAFPDRTRNKA